MQRSRALPVIVLLAAAVVALPFVWHLAGDALVHLAIAERFALGEPFRYQPGGEIVVASTSPFWTLLLTAFWRLAEGGSAILLKITVVSLWLGAGFLLVTIAQRDWNLPRAVAWGVGALWLAHTTVVANALGGLENVLSAFQLLLLFFLARQGAGGDRKALLLGGVWGWMALTRPDGALFGLAVLAAWLWSRPERLWRKMLLGALAAALVILPWYGYQWSVTGRLVTDSSVSRLYTARQSALELWPDLLYLHPKAIISLGTAFLPLVLGSAWFGLALLRGKLDWNAQQRWQGATALLLLAVGLAFYTFGVGAEAFGRYFLPIFPFLFLTGAAGMMLMYRSIAANQPTVATVVTVGMIGLLIAGSVFDYYRRVAVGRFESGPVLNVIYGPANRQYFSFNLMDAVQAPARREQATDELFAALDANQTPVSIAVTEVQLRYFVDERVRIISLDGRTSAEILPYFDERSGVPDFDAYLAEMQPDYVHANQWCRVGGWLSRLETSAMTENRICRWQEALSSMEEEGQMSWQGVDVVMVAPEIIRLEWRN